MRRSTIPAVLIVAIAAAGAVWWWRYGAATPVTVREATTGTAAEVVYASGNVEPRSWAKVTSLVSERIVEVCDDCEGETVAEGYLLVRLDDSKVRVTLGELEAQTELAQRELKRAENLLERSVGSEQAFDRASAEVARLEALRAVVAERLNDYLIRAPVSGQVLRLDASVGEIAQPGEALAHVGKPRPLEVVAEVNEEDIPKVETGQRVLIRAEAFADRLLEGSVGRITPMGDPVQRTYRVRIPLPDETPLFIGMSVDANIVIRETEGSVVVPVVALSGDQVFVVEGDRMVARPVTVGIRGLESAEILDGLAPGERFITPLPEDAETGARVSVTGTGR